MIRSTWRRIVRYLGSAGLATWLLAIVSVWSMFATFVPQGGASTKTVVAWASTHALVEPIVRVVGLHRAFTSPVFIACILVLGLSTALCAWQRTKVAIGKGRALRRAATVDEESLTQSHDLEVVCEVGLSSSEVLSVAAKTLGGLGVKTKRRGNLLAAVSSPWSVWGSPVFHWALLSLIVALIGGNLMRSEGLMGIAVGQTKADAPESYGFVSAGPLHNWNFVHRGIRVDAFEPQYRTGGIDRGPTPTVSVINATGKVVKTQRVYPNMTLSTGSLTIYPSDFGLATTLTLLSAQGVETGHSYQLADFSGDATGGTVPVGFVSIGDAAGKPLLRISVTVPLDRKGDVLAKRVPAKPAARVVVTSLNGAKVLDRLVSPGESVALPSGDTLRLDGVEYYARLQVVDDVTIPLLFAGLFVAMVGLAIAVLWRQQIVLATVVEDAEGVKLVATVRLWRNASSSRGEIESELATALSGVEKGSMT